MCDAYACSVGYLPPLDEILDCFFEGVATKSAEEAIIQRNGMREFLKPENRAIAERYYQSKGVGESVQDRLNLFTTDGELVWFYKFFQTHSGKDDYLAWLEWGFWQWDRVMG